MLFTAVLLSTLHSSLSTPHSVAEAAVAQGQQDQLDTGSTHQGGGLSTSSKFRQHGVIGQATATTRIASSKFRILPGLFAAVDAASSQSLPLSELDLSVLSAKTDALGSTIPPKTWQRDNDPLFIWEPPRAGAPLAGYSYAIDAVPDTIVDTAATSFEVPPRGLADGTHTFTVQAVNTAGKAGKPVSIEIWVDTTPPQILTYTPTPGALLNTPSSSISATLSDVASGVDPAAVSLAVNGTTASVTVDPSTGAVTARGGAWREGANSLELRVADAAGNAQTPLVWSVTLDSTPPTGTVTINGGASRTTSVYVTLGLAASDAVSGVARVLISNEELAGYVEEPFAAIRELWQLPSLRGPRPVYVKFVDRAGNVSAPVTDQITLDLLSPDTVITSGPAGATPSRDGSFAFMCPEGGCVFSFAFDHEEWSDWSAATTATTPNLSYGNHYFRVKAARDVNGTTGIQLDEEDPSPAERSWIVGLGPSWLAVPKGPPVKLWRLE